MKRLFVIISVIALNIGLFADGAEQLKNIIGAKPGDKPALLMPGLFHGITSYRDVAITPDGKEFYFAKMSKNRFVIMVAKCSDGRWSIPAVAPFSGKYSDFEPVISPDGKIFLFASNRPSGNKTDMSKDVDIYIMKRVKNGWSKPSLVGGRINSARMEYFPSITRSGRLYFGRNDMAMTRGDIHYSDPVGGVYGKAVKLPPQVNFPGTSYNAFIAPDESYIIFSAYLKGEKGLHSDMFISFRDDNDIWQQAVNMGKIINSDGHDHSPYVSYDGKYLFFSSTRERNPRQFRIYWVSTSFLNQLKKDVLKK